MSVYLLATLDTKGPEAAFVRDRLNAMGVEVQLVDTGCVGEPTVAADITRSEVFQQAGVSHEQIEDLVDVAVGECDRFYPAFQFVIWGGRAPQDALAASLLETQGEA